MIAASGRFDLPFTCEDSTGLPTAPTGTPTGTLVKNGTDLGTTVTVTMSTAQGVASCTIPSDAVNGDRFYLRISAVISGVTYVTSGPSVTVENSVTLPTAPTDWLTAAAVKADAVTKIQTGLATPTNITAGTMTTVTSLTNLPAAPTDWLTAAAVKADAVNKIQVGLATGSQVTALNNLSSLANLFGPTTMEIPDSSSTVFKFTLTVKDQEGLATALDASPTITVVNASGTSRAAGLSSVLNPATGEYTFTYTVTSADAPESLTFKAAGTVSAEARSAFWVSSVVDYNALTTIASIAALAQDIKNKTDQLTFTTANVVDASPTPAANIRTAIGLASANLDTQLSGIHDDTGSTNTVVQQFVDVDGDVEPVFRSWLGLAAANLDTQLSAIDDFLDTEIAAIKSKTDLIPASPAAVGSAMTLTSAYDAAKTASTQTSVDALVGYVDTEVAAIKAKTDNLPSDPADQSLLEAAITAAVSPLATSASVSSISDVTDKLDTALVLDGSVYQFTTNALENGPGGGSSTVLVYPLNASMPVKSVGPNLTFYKDESGTVVGPIQVSARSGNTITPVDLSGRTLEVRFSDYLGTELLTVVNADITVSGTDSDQFEFEVTTAVTGTPTEDHADQYHYWSLRDVSSGDNVLVAGRARVLLS